MRNWMLIGILIFLSGCLEAPSQSPTLLNSSITKIEVHGGLDGGSFGGDFIIINIYNNNTAGIEVGVYDSKNYIYKSAKQVPLEQILPDIERFVDLFKEGIKSKHVEAPLERSFAYDYIIDIYLKDGRRYGIAQIFKGPIYIVGHQKDFDFFLEKDSIAFQSPLLDIAVKNFDLSPEIQGEFFSNIVKKA